MKVSFGSQFLLLHTTTCKKPVIRIGYQEKKELINNKGAGIVRSVGKNVRSAYPGDPVLLSFFSCASCAQCGGGHPAYCSSFASENFVGRPSWAQTSGENQELWTRFLGQSSFAHYSIVAETCVVNVKDLINNDDELKLFAPLGCGLQTGMGAVHNMLAADAGADDVLVVIGLGPVGLASVMVSYSGSNLTGGTSITLRANKTAKIHQYKSIIAIDRSVGRLEAAKSLGATHCLNTATVDTSISKAIRNITPSGAAGVIDTTGASSLIEEGLKSCGARGTLILIGIPPQGSSLSINIAEHINVSL